MLGKMEHPFRANEFRVLLLVKKLGISSSCVDERALNFIYIYFF